MNESTPSGVNLALAKRGYNFTFADSEEANLQELRTRSAAEIRRAVFGIFQGLTGMQSGINWAIYSLPPKVAPIGEAGDDGDREILLIADTRDLMSIPDIRIITNECFDAGNKLQYLTEDFTLDYEHDALYFVDATEIQDETPLDEDSRSALFWEEDGVLGVGNYTYFTVTNRVASPDRPKQTVEPFGGIDSTLDQLDALASGRELLGEIAYAEPIHWGVQPDIG